jgi:2-keto-4-pentenoate hydratase/2-oxohepta-3-ene-1,7-dioic acid hydratase in catechol pathway
VRLFRFGTAGREKPGIVSPTGRLLDASSFGEDYDEAFFAKEGLERLAAWVQKGEGSDVPADARLGPPIARPSKIVCIGLNYRDHAKETEADIPEEPVVFMKATSALAGPGDDLELPRASKKTDWEVELAVVIGRRAKYVALADAMSHVAGFTVHNDYSEREFQLERGGQWDKGKGADGFAPLGPHLVTRDELDGRGLALWLDVNGQPMQRGNTSDMIFDVPRLVSYVSQFMTLLPGDVISTGTPHGVGLGRTPPVYLRAGDVVECGIEGIGRMSQRIVTSK